MNVAAQEIDSAVLPGADEGLTPSDYLRILLRRRKTAIGAAVLLFAVALGLAVGLPAVYQSSSVILIEQQDIPSDLVRSTVTSYADQRIETTSQRVMTTTNLLQIIERHGLYADERQSKPTEVVLEGMREDVDVRMISANVVDPRSGRPTKATIAFSVSYENESPRMAQRVASELSSLFMSENLRARRQAAEDTSTFLAAEATRLQNQLAELDRNLAEFKERNVGKLPELVQLNLQMMDRTERALIDVDREIREREQSEIFLAAQLAQIDPMGRPGSQVITTESGQQMVEPGDQLTVLRTSLAGLQARYSADHPDVVRTQKEIAALERRVGSSGSSEMVRTRLESARNDLANARERYSANHPDVTRLQRTVTNLEAQLDQSLQADDGQMPEAMLNPVYVDISTRRKANVVQLKSLRSKREELEEKIADYEARLVETPQVEREYRMLARNYESAQAKYEEVTAKQMEAQLAETMETEQRAERFTLIEPPQLPSQPDWPPRMAIVLLGFVLSLAGGGTAAGVAEALDDKIRDAESVTRMLGAPPLTTIPYIYTPGESLRRRLSRILAILLITGIVALAATWVHLRIMPFDVAWLTLRNKLGL